MHVDVNGVRLWFDVDGSSLVTDGPEMKERPTVVLVHGGPGGFDHSYFKPDFHRLAGTAQVIYLDLRDHGRSDRTDPEYWDLIGAGDDIRGFCDVLGITSPVVLGHSFGGPVVASYGSRHPGHASALVLQSTFARFDLTRVVEDFRRLGGEKIAEIVRRSYSDDPSVSADEWALAWRLFGHWVPGDAERSRVQRNAELAAVGGKLMQSIDVLEELSAIACPTLVSVGELDPITPVAVAREMVEVMKPGVAQLCVIENAGHFPWRDAPDRYWPALEEFIASVDKPA
ncbi:MAG: alpha/beta hydrolase [Actinomycetota bacterium]